MTEVTKVAPLRCPQCGSEKVKAGFTKRRGRAFTNDGRIWCYDCMKVTNTKTGKVKTHNYNIHRMEEDE